MSLTLLFDADDTILDFHKAEHIAISLTQSFFHLDKFVDLPSKYSVINDSIWKEYERGEIAFKDVADTRFVRLFAIYGLDDLDPSVVGQQYKEFLSQQAFFVRGMRKLLDKLLGRDDMYIITNGIVFTQVRRFKKAKLNKYFKNIFISQQIGYKKPQKEFFDHVKKSIANFDIEKTYIIGDSLTSDMQGGANSGIKTIWFNKA
ncbi:MAG: YjjG family noncanonical pyrimidine nucleotidase, partial [Clostridia bacterium]